METVTVEQPSVLIISDDTEFSRRITARWRLEPSVPSFTLMSGDLCPSLESQAFDAAIVGGLLTNAFPRVMKSLEACGKTVLFIRKEDEPAPSFGRKSQPATLIQSRHGEHWLDAAILIVSECFRTSQALARVERLEHSNSQMSRDAALGRYMLEMRHGLNNALTSVLGNSELLLLEPDELQPKVRSQIDTIRNMGLRINEIMQRFSSLEKELNVAERQAEKDGKSKAQSAGR